MNDAKWFGSNITVFTGLIEDNDDSTAQDGYKLGRCKVRLLGIHSEKKIPNDVTGEGIPTDKLHWAYVLNGPGMNGIGTSSLYLKGTWVLVLSMDGAVASDLYIVGTLPGVPSSKLSPSDQGFCDPDSVYPLSSHLNEEDVNRLARNEDIAKTIVQTKKETRDLDVPVALSENKWNQPLIPYNAEYPHNLVFESEFTDGNGHIVEFDSTPNNERIHQYHKAGTFTEIDKDGNIVNRIVGDNFDIISGTDHIHIKGSKNETIDGNDNHLIKGNGNNEVEGDVTTEIKGNNDNTIEGNSESKVEGTVKKEYEQSYELNVGTTYTQTIEGDFTATLSTKFQSTSQSGYNITDGTEIVLDAPKVSLKGGFSDLSSKLESNEDYISDLEARIVALEQCCTNAQTDIALLQNP